MGHNAGETGLVAAVEIGAKEAMYPAIEAAKAGLSAKLAEGVLEQVKLPALCALLFASAVAAAIAEGARAPAGSTQAAFQPLSYVGQFSSAMLHATPRVGGHTESKRRTAHSPALPPSSRPSPC